jgi:putative inorganic carbon (HCO3(-)) transporter
LPALLLGVAALVLTQSRSGWAAFAAAMLILTTRALRRRIGTKAILLICLVALLIGVGFSTQIMERLTTDDKGSAQTRLWHTKWALNILEDHMFTGVGLNNMWLLALRREYLPLEFMGRERLNIIHNKYWLVWVETGLFGFLSFLWLLLAVCRRALQSLVRSKDSYVSIAITGLLAALIVYMLHMSSDPFASRMRLQPLWMICALIAATSQLARKREQQI